MIKILVFAIFHVYAYGQNIQICDVSAAKEVFTFHKEECFRKLQIVLSQMNTARDVSTTAFKVQCRFVVEGIVFSWSGFSAAKLVNDFKPSDEFCEFKQGLLYCPKWCHVDIDVIGGPRTMVEYSVIL